MQLPGHGRRMGRNFLRTRLRPYAIRLNVAVKTDAPYRIRVGVSIRQVRALRCVGLQENHFRADLLGRTQSLNEGVGGLDRHEDRAFVIARFIAVKDHRDFRQAGERAAIGIGQKSRQLDRNDARPFGAEHSPQLDREFEPSRHDRKVAEPAALQAPGFNLSFEGHSAGPLRRGSARWQCAAFQRRRRATSPAPASARTARY